LTGAAASRQVHTGFVLPPRWRFGADRGQRSTHLVKFEQSGGGPTPPRKTPRASSHDEKKSMSNAMFE
jgi:hypothetical protein